MQLPDKRIGDWLAELAARVPTPGGGAAAAMTAAVSASLVGMVANYTTGKRWADREERMRQIVEEAEQLRISALALAEADEEAFGAVGAAYSAPKDTPEAVAEREAAIQRSLLGAAEPPLRVGELAGRLVELTAELATTGNPNVISDVAVASSTARSALESAVVNIEINKRSLTDPAEVARLGAAITRLSEVARTADEVTRSVLEGIRS